MFGFEICYLEHLDFAKQVDLCRAAEIIGGLHGAGLTNMLFMPGGGTVLEIRKTADTHSNCYFSMASALNHRYYYALADAVGDDVHVSDFYVRPARLQEVLSEMIVPDPGK